MLHQVDGPGASFGIVVGRNHAAGFVEHDIHMSFWSRELFATDDDVIAGRVDPCGQCVDKRSIDSHFAQCDEFFAAAARGHPRICKRLLQTDAT